MFCLHCCKTCFIILFYILVCAESDNVRDKRGNSERNAYHNDVSENQYFHLHHHHHHGQFPPDYEYSPEFHRGDPNFSLRQSNDRKDSTTYDDEVHYNETTKYIPLQFIDVINQHSMADLLRNYVEGDDEEYPLISSRLGDVERSESSEGSTEMAKAAGCSPELQTVSLRNSSDPTILYLPQCTKVERCSGCCSHNLLSCQPTQTEILTYKVLKTQYTGAKKLKRLSTEIVSLEKHLSCKCACKIKEEVVTATCNNYQEYRPSECRCICKNTDEEKKCYKSYNKKLWNSDLCACQCRDVFQCSTGQYFDNNECKCLASTPRRTV